MSRLRIAFLLLALAAVFELAARPYLVLFGSAGCESCAEIKSLWREREYQEGCPVLVYVSIDEDENYNYLKRVEQELAIRKSGSAFPLILVGGRMVSGLEGFYGIAPELELLLEEMPEHPVLEPLRRCAEEAQDVYAEWSAAGADAAPEEVPSQEVSGRILYLSTPGCSKCARQQRELELLTERHPGITVDHYQVSDEDGMIMRGRMIRQFSLTGDVESLVPAVAWKDGCITGRLAEAEEIAAALARQDSETEDFWMAPIGDAERSAMRGRWQQLLDGTTWLTMLGAGALDGINPCAFATVIFLVSYLLYLKRGKRYVLAVGLCFCASVFSAYFIFGLGLSFLVEYFASHSVVKQSIYGVMALLTLVLAALHLRDAVRFRRSGKTADMDMGLNSGTHRKIHDKIHKWGEVGGWLTFPAAVLLGLVVSSLELVCTGQIYLPVIVALNSAGFNLKALCWLLLYNLAFIAPLVAVTILAYCGIGANSIAKWARKNIFATKVAMSVLFLVIAAIMLALMVR
ncbi:MAG: hypothetical protein J6S21_04475 [Victivallales bacterium]|nr:hypothetical protein [Victivallales bacterium]